MLHGTVTLLLFVFILVTPSIIVNCETESTSSSHCTIDSCPSKDDNHLGSRNAPLSSYEESETFTEAYLARSTHLLRTETAPFFAHLFTNTSGTLVSQCPAILFQYNSAYIPTDHCPDFNPAAHSQYHLKYRCHHLDLDGLPMPTFHHQWAPVSSLTTEPYFGIPTPTSLTILVAHFTHNSSLPCVQLNPIGLTSRPKMDTSTEFALLIGNGHQARVVKYSDIY